MNDTAFERRVRDIGENLYRLAGESPPSLFDPRGLRGRVLMRAMHDEGLRAALFQFVDVLPVLETDRELARHFQNYLAPHADRLRGPWGRMFKLGGHSFSGFALRRAVSRLARQFVVEEQEDRLNRALNTISRIPAAVTVDAVGEAALSERECDIYLGRYLSLLDLLAANRLPLGHPPIHISVKLSALTAHFDPLDYAGVRRRVFARLEPLVARLRELGAGMTVDMEHYELKSLTLRLFRDLVESEGDDGWHPGIALQAYLPETADDLRELIDWAEREKRRISVRLVKGAYWDTEVALAEQRNWPVPVFLDKSATDAQFESLVDLLFRHADAVYPAVGSHNLRSLAYAIASASRQGLSTADWEVQMLYGMAEPLRHAVAASDIPLRVYLPTGELIPGIAYLIRRLMENTANTSILRQTYVEGADLDDLLAAPDPHEPGTETLSPAFLNAPLKDFSHDPVREDFRRSLAAVRTKLGATYPLDMAGVPPQGAELEVSRNPARPSEILGHVAVADVTHAERAVRNAYRAFPGWRDTPAAARVALCRRAADIMDARRGELAAWQVLETGKNWREADADVAEAVDYLRYYPYQMEQLAGWRPTRRFPGEPNHLRYEPRGVAAVIPPWNFPLAILTGMTAAALVAGNTAIVKPATPANLVAHGFKSVLDQAGFPPGVCQLLPGSGATVGRYLVKHPDVHVIAFTGSKTVGLEILREAHTLAPEQRYIKQVVCEMGGKNAIIVDEDADLDEAVAQTLYSAFGYQGQKCSACSRLIAVGRVHDRLVKRLTETLDSYDYGPPEDPAFLFGPMITRDAQQKAMSYIELGRTEGRLHYLGRVPADGFYCPPAIITGIESHHRLAREEIFGPVLAVLRAPTFEAALTLALESDYALTGGVFSRLPEHLDLARERYRVGNLYLNRRTTGARVGVQPFGGTRLSGTGVQAGGPDYLKQFLWTRVVSENTLRHGFVPNIE
ncbi:proline dehydrogenase family protein [Methylocaldum sp. RMAD-M]|uniref:proline dehydrogenase family protein n=1 Tax=Methylocaldum sp. RMAD-M TaxID=2806557 RepID=UPI001AE8FD02|nr:proline dehydrogenase family protein [Methylocaldum sp. RMAD-M]MBP1149824.1 RHH-type proline utilization regulon transcriptional repressor/proline dehydrogenase/delta 1-pyrroline-5-carboxylate dehydrogenase [Methylocaldum sp. RMAD-M]